MKKQPATAILGAALNAHGYSVLHDYMRVHQPELFRDYARHYVAAALPSGKRYVAQQLVNTWEAWPARAKDDFLQRHRADKPKDVEFYVQYASDEFIDQFPATLHGYKPGHGEYWYEPLRGKYKDRPEYEVEVENDLMGPRFMKGAKLQMQRVLSKREIQPGRVYYYWNGHGGDLFRVERVRGRQVLTSYDKASVDGEGPITITRTIGDLFNKQRWGFKKLLVFVDYAGSGNPAKWALMQELRQTAERQVAARKQQEAEKRKKAAAAKRAKAEPQRKAS